MDGRNSTGARISLLNDSAQQKTGASVGLTGPGFGFRSGSGFGSRSSSGSFQGPIVRSQSDFGAGSAKGLRRPTSLAHYHFGSSSSLHSTTSTSSSHASSSSQLFSSHPIHHSHANPPSHSRTSSFTSTPQLLSSPPTPQLIRSDSSDSQQSRSSSNTSISTVSSLSQRLLIDRTSKMNLDLDYLQGLVNPLERTPSPITPVGLGFEPLAVHTHASPEATLKAFTNDPSILLQAPFSILPQSYLPSLDPVDTKIPTTSASPRSATSLHQYPALGSRQPGAPFAYPLAVQHQPIMQTSMPPNIPLYPTQPQLSHPSHQPQMTSQQQNQASTSPNLNNNNGPAKNPGKKNQYPCPLAKEYNCNNFFTTSGHAARHAKKHTGKKDAYCPECNKAFTRKDNMEQHRRTHQNGRNASKVATSASASSTASTTTAPESAPPAKRQKTSTSSSPQTANAKRPKIAPLQPAVADLNTSPVMIDPNLPISPASSFGFADAIGLPVQNPPQGLYPADLLQQTPFGIQSSPYPINGPYYDSNNMSGLDKLAMAASASNEGSRSGSF